MRTPTPTDEKAHPRARHLLVLIAAFALWGCHPGNVEAMRLRQSCEGGDVEACNQLAVKLQKGEYVLRDERRAADLFDQACIGGVGEGCASLGLIYQRSRSVRRDSARALSLFQKGCEGG